MEDLVDLFNCASTHPDARVSDLEPHESLVQVFREDIDEYFAVLREAARVIDQVYQDLRDSFDVTDDVFRQIRADLVGQLNTRLKLIREYFHDF